MTCIILDRHCISEVYCRMETKQIIEEATNKSQENKNRDLTDDVSDTRLGAMIMTAQRNWHQHRPRHYVQRTDHSLLPQLHGICWKIKDNVCACASLNDFYEEHVVSCDWWTMMTSENSFIFPDNRFYRTGHAAFSALTLWLSARNSIWPVKNGVMRCWRGYLSGAQCKWSTYDPTDATASLPPYHLLLCQNAEWFNLSGAGLPRLSWKAG